MSTLETPRQEPRAQSVTVSDEELSLDLVDGRRISVPLVWYPRLWYATPDERLNLEVFGDGSYIHWPDVDEDLTVSGILEGRRSVESPDSIKKWLSTREKQPKT